VLRGVRGRRGTLVLIIAFVHMFINAVAVNFNTAQCNFTPYLVILMSLKQIICAKRRIKGIFFVARPMYMKLLLGKELIKN
jgi:hypothetical protein